MISDYSALAVKPLVAQFSFGDLTMTWGLPYSISLQEISISYNFTRVHTTFYVTKHQLPQREFKV